MTDLAYKALAELSLTLAGQLHAVEVVQDAIVATLLTTSPGLAQVLLTHLEKRYDTVPGGLEGQALKAFHDRFYAVDQAVRAMIR